MLFKIPSRYGAQAVKTVKIKPLLSAAEMSVAEALPSIEHGYDYPYASAAEWSAHDLIFQLIDLIGPAHLIGATWSISEAATHKLIERMDAGELLSISMLVDWRVKVRTPGFLVVAKSRLSNIRISNCHAKTYVLRNDEWAISMTGSPNLTNNPRIEAGHISTSPEVAAFHERWILAEIKNSKPFGLDMAKAGRKDGRK